MAFGGLRGAIAFSLAFSLYRQNNAIYEDIPDTVKLACWKDMETVALRGSHNPIPIFAFGELFLQTTLVLVILTVFIQGTLTPYLLRFLRTRREHKHCFSHVEMITRLMAPHLRQGIHEIANGDSIIHKHWFKRILHHTLNFIDYFIAKDHQENLNLVLLKEASKDAHAEFSNESFTALFNKYWDVYDQARNLQLVEGTAAFEYFVADEMHEALVREIDRFSKVQPILAEAGDESSIEMARKEADVKFGIRRRTKAFGITDGSMVHKRIAAHVDPAYEAWIENLIENVQNDETLSEELKMKIRGRLSPPEHEPDLEEWLKLTHQKINTSQTLKDVFKSSQDEEWITRLNTYVTDETETGMHVDKNLIALKSKLLSNISSFEDKQKTFQQHQVQMRLRKTLCSMTNVTQMLNITQATPHPPSPIGSIVNNLNEKDQRQLLHEAYMNVRKDLAEPEQTEHGSWRSQIKGAKQPLSIQADSKDQTKRMVKAKMMLRLTKSAARKSLRRRSNYSLQDENLESHAQSEVTIPELNPRRTISVPLQWDTAGEHNSSIMQETII